MFDVYESFRGKTVFFTGVTGFVGKVFLWKLLKEFPDMERVYVLIRTKKGQKPQDRLAKDVFTSQCWEPLRKIIGEEELQRRFAKVTAVSGDITEDRLGLSDADYDAVADHVNFIVHMAATVNFDERIDISVKMNVLGSLRVMALAQRAPKLQAYVHMSTCYVNHQRHGRHQTVREVIYPLPFDAEDMCKFILSQAETLLPLVTKRVLSQHGFPNTYTLTKSMGEQLLERRKGNLPLVIIRPAIVACSWREPMPGWVDALTAAGGIYLTFGLGILRELYCDENNVADLVPVDYVVNTTIKMLHRTHTFYQHKDKPNRSIVGNSARPGIAAAAMTGKGDAAFAVATAAGGVASNSSMITNSAASDSMSTTQPSLPFIYQSATSSSMNLMRWETARIALHDYWHQNPHPKAVTKCDMTLINNEPEYLFRLWTRRIIPVKVLGVIASLPIIGDPNKKKLVTRLERAVFRSRDMQRQFAPFMTLQWCFDSANVNALDESVKPEQVKNFSTDVYDINWHALTMIYSYGMIKYIMKTDDGRSAPIVPESGAVVFNRSSL